MLRSLNEVTSELRKACLGAGFPVGHAEDLSKAATLLIANEMDGTSALLSGLKTGFRSGEGDHTALDQNAPIAKFCSAQDGFALLETLYVAGNEKSHELNEIDAPDLLLGIAMQFAKIYGCGVKLETADRNLIEVSKHGAIHIDQILGDDVGPASLKITVLNLDNSKVAPVSENAKTQSGSVNVNETLWPKIKSLAAKTYVPASEASRLKGAGAIINDSE